MSQQAAASSDKTRSCFSRDLDNYKDFVRRVQADPEIGKFRFSARTEGHGGTITQTPARGRVIYAAEPEALGGQNSVPIRSRLEILS